MTYLYIFAIVMLAMGIYTLLVSACNIVHFRNIEKKAGNVTEGPLISVIIPARNEENHLPNLLESLRTQSYRNIEILVINDCSTDRTQDVIDKAKEKDPRIRAFMGSGERNARNGKVNAMMQILPEAKGEFLYCTDADTVHGKDAISFAYSVMKDRNLDIISGFPAERCESYMGAVNMSAMLFCVVFIPHFLARFVRIPALSVAIGQFIMMRTSAYKAVGGYESIKNNVCDDMSICRLFVENGMKYHFVTVCQHITCNMYKERKEAFNGIARSLNGAVPMSAAAIPIVAIILFTFAHLVTAPLVSLVIPLWSVAPLSMMYLTLGWIMFYFSWFLSAIEEKLSIKVSISGPIAIFQTGSMYLYGIWVRLTGRHFTWKGRQI